MDKNQLPRCNRCVHYYITHDSRRPYGCRCLGFISKRQPMLDVLESSGHPCLYFAAKPKPARRCGNP